MIAVITHGPGTLTGRTPVTVSTLLVPGSVTLKVSGPTCRMAGVVFQRLRAQAATTIAGLLSQGWWPLFHAYCAAQYCGQLVKSQMPGNLPRVTWVKSMTTRAGLVSVYA